MDAVEEFMTEFLISQALKRGWAVSVHDDLDGAGEWTVNHSTNPAEILSALCTTGGDMVRFFYADGCKVGTVWLVYGNGADLIHDVTANAPAELTDLLDDLLRAGIAYEQARVDAA